MLEEKDLLAISQILDAKLAQQKEEILAEAVREMRVLLDAEVKPQFGTLKEEILAEVVREMRLLLDAEVKPQFNLLAEDLQLIQEKLVPSSRIDNLEDEVALLKAAVRRINEDLQTLKKAQ